MDTPIEQPAARWRVTHSGSLYYPSTRDGVMRAAVPGQIIDDLPPESRIDGKPRPNWVIAEGLVEAYTGDAATGTILPLTTDAPAPESPAVLEPGLPDGLPEPTDPPVDAAPEPEPPPPVPSPYPSFHWPFAAADAPPPPAQED